MKSYVLSGSDVDSIKQVSGVRPESPGNGEIIVKMRAASLNFRDLMVLTGLYGERKNNLVPLSDGAGEVVAVGAGVTEFGAGDRVALTFHLDWIGGKFSPSLNPIGRGGGDADGVLTEYVCVKASEAVLLPSYMSYEQGATLPCAAVTAWTALTQYDALCPGETVVVQGTGGVSIFALQMAKLFGARVIATSSSEEKLHTLKALGADDVINYRTRPDWDQAVLELTDGVGADVVVEVAGGETFAKSVAATRMGGRISVIGLLSGMPALDHNFFIRMQSIHPIRVGSREHFVAMNKALSTHRLKPLVDRVFHFSEAVEAFRYFEARQHLGKVVIAID
ncbi:MAG: NAD(P)-dependent alcohol dehydrogenase [Porticoccaceae bacterium]|nr:NAD(P)-dependent alcohol dehydrogenase [Porticoccaceae bacterium]